MINIKYIILIIIFYIFSTIDADTRFKFVPTKVSIWHLPNIYSPYICLNSYLSKFQHTWALFRFSSFCTCFRMFLYFDNILLRLFALYCTVCISFAPYLSCSLSLFGFGLAASFILNIFIYIPVALFYSDSILC